MFWKQDFSRDEFRDKVLALPVSKQGAKITVLMGVALGNVFDNKNW